MFHIPASLCSYVAEHVALGMAWSDTLKTGAASTFFISFTDIFLVLSDFDKIYGRFVF